MTDNEPDSAYGFHDRDWIQSCCRTDVVREQFEKNLMPTNNSRMHRASRASIKRRVVLALAVVLLSSWLAAPLARAGVTLTNLVSFNGTNGANPEATLIQGVDGNFYGTTYNGGTNGGYGTVFQMTPNGALTTLVSFNNTNGANPQCALVLCGDGNFYGTTSAGGTNGDNGTVFRMTASGALTSLHSFGGLDGSFSYAGLTIGADGGLYGSTVGGGANESINGTLFRITTNGVFTSLVSFNNTNGATPYAAPSLAADGNFYGTTTAGGASTGNFGTIYEMTTNGAMASLYSFSETFPFAGLIQGRDGNFYGTTFGGTTNPSGTIFRLTLTSPPPVIQSVTQVGQTLGITWSSVFGQKYQVEYTTNLNAAVWHNLGAPVIATNVTATVFDAIGPDPQRFYRVALVPNTPPAPVIQSLTQNDSNEFVITWTAVVGQKYQLKYANSLKPGSWQNLNAPVTATSSTITVHDPAVSDPQRFYRVALLL